MRSERMVKSNVVKVSATVTSPDDIHLATVTIALHDDTGAADSWLAATWSTTPTQDASTGLWSGVAQTTAAVDFTTKALGNYVVRAKAGTTVVDCYILKVVP